jgi:hypothetical protein
VQPTCLGWSDAGLFACADQKTSPFSIGLSKDFGSTFETVLRFETLCGETGCGPATACGMSCPRDWTIVGPSLGSTCGLDAGTPDAEPDAASDARSDEDTSADAPLSVVDAHSETAPPPGPSGDTPLDVSGGGCAIRPMAHRGNWTALLALLWILRHRRGRRDQFLTIT